MTKTSKKSEEYEYFMPDARLFLLWRISVDGFLPKKHDYIPFYDLFPTKSYPLELGFEDIRLNTNLDERFEIYFYNDSDIPKSLPNDDDILSKFSNKEFHRKILKSAKNIRANDFSSIDITYLSKFLSEDAYHEMYLDEREGVEQSDEKLKNLLDNYIQKFIDGDLLITDINYYNFQKQKELFIKLIRDAKMLEEYARNFIISNNQAGKPFYKDYSSLLIHTIYALEYLGYVKILNIDFDSNGIVGDYYEINILPKESFKELIYQDFKKENPKTVIGGYDEKKGVLTFSGKQISISKSGKETDATLLIKTLLKTEGDDYLHNDEIFEDWGFNEEDVKKATKNKIYFAGQNINKAIQLSTGVEDFLDITTTKARINPKYRS